MERSKIVVVDFGSQYAHLIAKRFRSLGYYSEIVLPSANPAAFSGAKGVVFSGGPASIYGKVVPDFNGEILSLKVPILGLCYGHYVLQQGYGGKVGKAAVGEFGFATFNIDESKRCPLFEGIEGAQQVWMSHQDAVLEIGRGFECVGSTKDCAYAALQNLAASRFSLQFHCEVRDTPCGLKIFDNFARFCGMEKNWDEDSVLNHILNEIQKDVGERRVLLFLSGGVDSTVSFALLNKALGQEKVWGLHIDNGFMRKNESACVAEAYKAAGFKNFVVKDASGEFLAAVSGLTDPQKKRQAVGETFVRVRDEAASELGLDADNTMLAQGTLYPDIIESGGTRNSNTIKTHHNRVRGIQDLISRGLVVEPLKDLYKDEVRKIGKKLGLPDTLVMRHPFPGPGLSINVLCSDGKMSTLDTDEFQNASSELSSITIDNFCPDCTAHLVKFVLPVRSVGVQGDFRTYRFPCVLSFGEEGGGFYHVPRFWEKLEQASSRITNSASYINRTVIRLWQNPALSDGDLKLQKAYCDKNRLDMLRDADDIVLTKLRKSGWYGKIFQHLTIILPYASSGERCSFVLRPVCSEDVMTARFAHLPQDLLREITEEIAALPFTDAVYYDVTNKPPATFCWE